MYTDGLYGEGTIEYGDGITVSPGESGSAVLLESYNEAGQPVKRGMRAPTSPSQEWMKDPKKRGK